MTVFAVGATPETCVAAFCDSLGDSLDDASLEPLDGDPEAFQWGLRFKTRGTGTGFKAAGRWCPAGP